MDFSLIIPTHNRRDSLLTTLAYLERLHFPREGFEALVVDDGSSDGTAEAAAALTPGYSLQVFRQDRRRGTGAARNRAIRLARGRYCLFIDDDVLASPDLLHLHAEAHRGSLRRLVRGPVINVAALPPEAPGALWQHYSLNYFCTSNASLWREHLLEAGLFDEDLERQEDAELGVRLKRLGLQRRFVPQAYVHHFKPPLPLEQLARTRRADGRSAAQLLRRYPGLRMRLRTGLHALNYLRNDLLCARPLARVLQSLPPLQAVLKAQQLDREYLLAGREELKR